jgi:hypothetical protein
MQNKGHQILFTLREKEFEIALLKSHVSSIPVLAALPVTSRETFWHDVLQF